MNYRFAVEWLKAFRDSSETVCKLYADDCVFEDLMLGQSIDNKDDLHRVFAPYANTDRTNGIGLHNFRVDEYVGDENDGVIFWSWKAEDTGAFLGIPTAGELVGTSGHTVHHYENGKIKRESTYWDAASILADMGQPISKAGVTAPAYSAGAV